MQSAGTASCMPNKYLSRSAVFAWSPPGIALEGLVTASAAQHVDSSFNASSQLDFVSQREILDAKAPEIRPAISLAIEERFNCLAWSAFSSGDREDGLIFAGGENGSIVVYNGSRFNSTREPPAELVVGRSQAHHGHVLGLDVNPHNCKLICSGAGQGQVFIWDLHNPTQPMSPGNPPDPAQVVSVRWNRSIEHVLASLCSERCSIWDLRRGGTPLMSIGDLGSYRASWRHLDWSADTSTLIAIASDDDAYPIVHLWDLRYTNSPVRQTQLHQRGIVAMDWCAHDARLLLTAGKDGRILLEDSNTGMLIGEVDAGLGRSWARQVRFCTWNPNLLAVASLDERITLHSMDGSTSTQTLNEMGEANPIVPSIHLSCVPRWQRRGAVGAQFVYGARLVTFATHTTTTEMGDVIESRVHIEKIHSLVDRRFEDLAQSLQSALDSNQLAGFCEDNAHSTTQPDLQMLWTYLSAHCLNAGRTEFLRIEAHDVDEMAIETCLGSDYRFVIDDAINTVRREQDEQANDVAGQARSPEPLDNPDALQLDANNREDSVLLSLIADDPDAAVLFCVQRGQWASAFQLADIANPALHRFVVEQYQKQSLNAMERLVSLVASDDWNAIVDSWPIPDWRRLFRFVLSRAPADRLRSLCARIAHRMLQNGGDGRNPALPAIVSGDVELLLRATEQLPLQERVCQAMVLRASIGGGSGRTLPAGKMLNHLLMEYCTRLADSGLLDLAWRAITQVPVENEELTELRYRLYHACGGRERLQQQPPPDPYQAEKARFTPITRQSSQQSTITQPYRMPTAFPQHVQSGLAGYRPTLPQTMPMQSPSGMMRPQQTMPSVPSTPPVHGGAFVYGHVSPIVPSSQAMMQPSAIGYQQQPIPPSMNAFARPAEGSAMMNGYPLSSGTAINARSDASAPGWNDPPVLAAKTRESRPVVTAEIAWQPASPQVPDVIANPPTSRRTSGGQANGGQIASVPLGEEDLRMVSVFRTLANAVINANATPMVKRRVEEAMAKIESELVPRLAAHRISSGTRGRLQAMASCAEQWDYGRALHYHREMVATCDMAEISAFMPALKMLLSSLQTPAR